MATSGRSGRTVASIAKPIVSTTSSSTSMGSAGGEDAKQPRATLQPPPPPRAYATPAPATTEYERRRARSCDAGAVCTTPGGGFSSRQYRGYCHERCYFKHLLSLGKELPRCKNWERNGCPNYAFRGRQCNRSRCPFKQKKTEKMEKKTKKK